MDDDLSTSVWDDVVTPPTQSTYNLNQGLPDVLRNQFDDMSLNRDIFGREEPENSHKDDDADDDVDDEHPHHSDDLQVEPLRQNSDLNGQFLRQNDSVQQSIVEQQNQLRKEENAHHKSQLISELTHNENGDLEDEESFISPRKPQKQPKQTDSLFNDKESVIKVTNDGKSASPHKVTVKNTHLFKTPRPRKYGSKLIVKHLQLPQSNANVNLPIDESLGPLGATYQESPEKVSPAHELVKEAEAPLYGITKQQSPIKQPHKDQPTNAEEASTSVLPTTVNHLDINVGDPMKVGDITNAHIVYTIKTKNKNPQQFSLIPESATVIRRYKDFRWLYHQLQHSYPGRIIPPPPTKQTYIGRFNENFIENRRLSLEKMLTKISSNAILNQDKDFMIFLTSEEFNSEAKGAGGGGESSEFIDNEGEDSVIFDDMPTTSSSNGFMSSFFSMSTKVEDKDEFFIKKKQYIDDLEAHLKSFYRAIEIIGQQRTELIGIYDEICNTIDELSKIEMSKLMGELMGGFVDIQLKLRDNFDQINLQDQLTLGFTIEEYLRIINSIKTIFETRLNIYQQYHNFSQELSRKQAQLTKTQNKYKQQPEKIELLNFEIDKLQQRTTACENKFTTISEVAKEEMAKFELERINDFRNSVEIYIESSIESQKEAIELYETFYERYNLTNV
jgi:sorting nexin-1/2